MIANVILLLLGLMVLSGSVMGQAAGEVDRLSRSEELGNERMD